MPHILFKKIFAQKKICKNIINRFKTFFFLFSFAFHFSGHGVSQLINMFFMSSDMFLNDTFLKRFLNDVFIYFIAIPKRFHIENVCKM